MDLNKCVKCGKLFASSEELCNNCLSKDLQDMADVRNFILDNPEITDLNEIADNTNVSSEDILRYISKGRFNDIKHLGKYFKCIYCNQPITMGKYCDNCIEQFAKIRNELLDKKNPKW